MGIQKKGTEKQWRQNLFEQLKLSTTNQNIAEKYLDMETPEDMGLLAEAEPQDFFPFRRGSGDYVEMLWKKKRTQELGRYLRFLVKVGGAMAWPWFLEDAYKARAEDLEETLPLLGGENAWAERLAVRGGLCVSELRCGHTEEARALCLWGREHQEVFPDAIGMCYDFGRELTAEKGAENRMFLSAVYLHHMPPEAAPEMVRYLEKRLTDAVFAAIRLPNAEEGELLSWLRTADRGTPFPRRLLSVLSKGGMNRMLGVMIGICAFLAIRHSVRLELLLRIVSAVDAGYRGPESTVLKICMEVTGPERFDEQMAEIEKMLPAPDGAYLIWCMKEQYEGGINRVIAGELARENAYLWQEEAAGYLMGTNPLEVLEPCMSKWKSFDVFREQICLKIEKLKEIGAVSMYRRAVVLEIMRKESGYFKYYRLSDQEKPGRRVPKEESLLTDQEQVRAMICVLEEEGVPVGLMAEGLSGMWDGLKDQEEKAAFLERCIQVVEEKLKGQNGEAWEAGLKEVMERGSTEACCLCLHIFARIDGSYRALLFSCAGNPVKQVRELLLFLCESHREWEGEILSLLASKKVRERELAVLVLETWEEPCYLSWLREALEKEKNAKLARLMEEVAGALKKETDAGTAGSQDGSWQPGRETERIAAGILRGAAARKVEWVKNLALPEVRWKNGMTVSPDYMLSLLAAYAQMDTPGIKETAAGLARFLAQDMLADYMYAVYEGWLEMGAEAKKRWILYAFSIHGGEKSASVLYRQIDIWAGQSRGTVAMEAVHALAENGSQDALFYIEQMSRKSGFRQVKHAAAEVFAGMAARLGIDQEELRDRLVPDLGPSVPGKRDDPERAVSALKQMKQQVKTVVADQKKRLEQAFVKVRFWQVEKWQALFVKNPIMRLFATELIWGVYQDNSLQRTFRYMEDGSFNTANGEECTLPEAGMIGLVHPLELADEELAAWKEQLSDYEVRQPFPQLERPVYRLAEEEEEKTAFTRFYGTRKNGRVLSERLLSEGWIQETALGAGVYTRFFRNDTPRAAELTVSGCAAGWEYEEGEVMLSELCFYRFSKEAVDETALQKAPACPLSKVSPRYFSEVVLQVMTAVGILW